jgi:hypothetical protein
LTDLQLSEDPDAPLAEQALALDAALWGVVTLLSVGAIDAQVDEDGRPGPGLMSCVSPSRRA